MRPEQETVRLDSLLRRWGISSRKQTRELAAAGEIQVDGITVSDPSMHVTEDSRILIHGTAVQPNPPIVLMMHKPTGYVSVAGEAVYPSIFSLLPAEYTDRALFAIGRLDADTSGLILMTNDGQLGERIARPERNIAKCYHFTADRPLAENAESILAHGAVLPNGTQCRPALLKRSVPNAGEITVTEGMFHEVRRLVRVCGARVATLKRISIGKLQLDGNLNPGEVRPLTQEEIEQIFL